jgi:hypothetical protein
VLGFEARRALGRGFVKSTPEGAEDKRRFPMDGVLSPRHARRPGTVARWLLAGAGTLVLAIAVAGFGSLTRYETRPGEPALPSARWEACDLLELAPDRPTLLVFAHPQCPCTRATFDELDRIAARSAGRLRVIALFAALPGRGVHWVRDDLWERAAAIPGVEVREDPGAALASRLGVRTSGQTLLYGADGRLLFEGGITAARGHVADNPGVEAIVDVAMGRDARRSSSPVFGCSLGCEDALGEQGENPCPAR